MALGLCQLTGISRIHMVPLLDRSVMDFELINQCELFAVELAKKAGQMMVDCQVSGNLQVETKKNWRDLVTQVDLEVERFIFDSIRRKYPDHSLIGEESAGTSSVLNSDLPTWIVDPIDGTVNYVHQNPLCCVSIGLAVNKQLVMGVIFAPFLDRLYTAVKGSGAKCNGKPIRSTDRHDIENTLLLYEPKYGPTSPYSYKIFENLLWKCQGVRYIGSACICLCMLAEGSADAFLHERLCIWDMAAGYVIANEAGAVAVTCGEQHFDPNGRSILAGSTSELVNQIAHQITLSKKK